VQALVISDLARDCTLNGARTVTSLNGYERAAWVLAKDEGPRAPDFSSTLPSALHRMQRTVTQEILDSPQCPADDAAESLRDLNRINRWFGGVATTRKLIERVATATGRNHFSILEVAAGFAEVPKTVTRQLAAKGIALEITLLDHRQSHLLPGSHAVVADALALPFPDNSFDLISCSLFAHHLEPAGVVRFVAEASRVSRRAVLINDLIRHPLHLASVYAGFPLMRSYVSRNDGVASVRRAYTLQEMREILSSNGTANKVEISPHFLFRMGVIVWNR
jgi:ubiquinone/menaquinone biosynthesis C-methylase UbiE